MDALRLIDSNGRSHKRHFTALPATMGRYQPGSHLVQCIPCLDKRVWWLQWNVPGTRLCDACHSSKGRTVVAPITNVAVPVEQPAVTAQQESDDDGIGG